MEVSIIVPVYNVENYITDMLKSLKNQMFKDFEVVIINDGSTDRSADFIKDFVMSDDRFKLFNKTNGGVASARNMGIEKAQGKYVVFYDPDDYIPPKAIEKMYKTAKKQDADIVIGVMEEKNLGESTIYMHSQKLAKQKKIHPTDVHFFGAWSLCHKIFSLEFIRENNLKIENVKNAEDGVFTFCALNCTEKIFGCNVVAYNYFKRPFWLTPSVTQTISREYLDNVLKAHKRILFEAEKLGDKYFDKEGKEKYLQELFLRFIDIEIINGYYRNIWRAEENLIHVLQTSYSEYGMKLSDNQWEKIFKKNRDLKLERGLLTLAEIAKEPIVSIIISSKLNREDMNLALGSIYNQSFPFFQVLIPQEAKEQVESTYGEKLNLFFIGAEENVVEKAKGEFILFLEEPVMFTKQSIRIMAQRLFKKGDLDFVSMLLKTYNGEEYKDIECLMAAYGYTSYGKRKFNSLTGCDTFMSNKLIRKSAMEHFLTSEYIKVDSNLLYEIFSFEKLKKGLMVTRLSEKEILERKEKMPFKVFLKFHYMKNRFIKNTIENMKRYITREDIDNIKRKFGKQI